MKPHCNGNMENLKLVRSEIAFLDLVKPTGTKHTFSVYSFEEFLKMVTS
jgi:hypothetical protein